MIWCLFCLCQGTYWPIVIFWRWIGQLSHDVVDRNFGDVPPEAIQSDHCIPLVYSHWITPNWKFWNAGWIVYTQALSKAGVPLTTGWVIRKSYAQNLLFKSCYYDWCASAISASGFLEDAFTVYFCVGESTRHEDLWNEYGYSHINHNCPHHNHHMPLTCHCLVDHIHGFGWVTVEP